MRAVGILLLLVMALGCGDRPPVIERVWATPDSVPRGGVAYLQVRAEDPQRGELAFRWQAKHGTVEPDTGDSVLYIAPMVNIDDTVSVLAVNEQNLSAEGTVIVYVREGLCGGRPLELIFTEAELFVADSARVFFVEPAGGRWEFRRMSVDGVDRDTVVTRPYEPRRLVESGDNLFWLERDAPGPDSRWRVMSVSKSDSGPSSEVAVFSALNASVTDIAVSAGQVHVAWLETVGDTGYIARITSFPRGGGAGQERFELAGPRAEATTVSRLVADRGDLFFLVASANPERVAVMRLPAAGPAVELVGSDLLAPGTLAGNDRIAVAGDDVFWSERVQGRIGRVGRDGGGAEFVVPAGDEAREVSLLLAAKGPGGTGSRLFWVVPDDLRGMVVETGAVIRDLDRDIGTIVGLAGNELHLFYVQHNGASRMFRLLIL